MVSQQFPQMRSVVIKLTFGVVINVAISCVNEVDAQHQNFHNRNSNRSRNRNTSPQWQQQYSREIFSNTNSHRDQLQSESESQSAASWNLDQRHQCGPGRKQRRRQPQQHRLQRHRQNSLRGDPRYSSDSEQTDYPLSSSTSALSSGADYWGQQPERRRNSQRSQVSPPLHSTPTYRPQKSLFDEPPRQTLGDYLNQENHYLDTFPNGRKYYQHSRWGPKFRQYRETRNGQNRYKTKPKYWPFSNPGKYYDFILDHWMDDVLPVFKEECERRNLGDEEQYLLYRFLREVVYQYNLGDSDRKQYLTVQSGSKKRNTQYWGKIVQNQPLPTNLKEVERARVYPSYFQEFLVEKILRNHGIATQNAHESCCDFRILGMQNTTDNTSKEDISQGGFLFAKMAGNLTNPWQVEVKSVLIKQNKIKCGNNKSQALHLCQTRDDHQKRVQRSFLQQVVKCQKKVILYDQQHVNVTGPKKHEKFNFSDQNKKHSEQNPTYAEFSYPDRDTMPHLPTILDILDEIVNRLNIPTYYPELTRREMQQEFPYYMGVESNQKDFTTIEQQYFRTLYGESRTRKSELNARGITSLHSQLGRFTRTSKAIFETKEQKGKEWLVDGSCGLREQCGITKRVLQPQQRRQKQLVEVKSDDSQANSQQPEITRGQQPLNLSSPPAAAKTNSPDTLVRDLSWSTISSGSYPDSSSTLEIDCANRRPVSPPRISIPEPVGQDLINKSNVGTKIELNTPGTQPESAEYFPRSSPDVDISDREMMELNYPVTTPETYTGGELILQEQQYPTMPTLPQVEPKTLRERKNSELDLSLLPPAVTPPKQSKNTSTLLGVQQQNNQQLKIQKVVRGSGREERKSLQKLSQSAATPSPQPLPTFNDAVNVNDADQQQLNKKFAKELKQQQLDRQIAEHKQEQLLRKLEKERLEEEMEKRELTNKLRQAEEHEKLVQMREQLVEQRQRQILGANHLLQLDWQRKEREIQIQQTHLKMVEQNQNQQLLQQQMQLMTLNPQFLGALPMNPVQQQLITQLNLQKLKHQARVTKFAQEKAQAWEEQKQQQQMELQQVEANLNG